jgi:CelD/BcsL family acetyltransferase involved in cellulose biosynthesis
MSTSLEPNRGSGFLDLFPHGPSPDAFTLTTIGNVTVAVTDRVEHLDPYWIDWEELAAVASEANVFYEPWVLVPAVRAFGAGQDLRFVLLFAAPDGVFSSAKLVGFFPLCYERGYGKLPVGVLRLWRHLHCFLSTPLLRAGYEQLCFKTLLQWLRLGRADASMVELGCMGGDGPVQEALRQVLSQRGKSAFEVEAFERALLLPAASPEAYLEASVSPGSLKELRRLRRRLEELGTLECQVLRPGDALEGWLDDFLQLEAQGWKGDNGTALAQNQAEQAFFRDAARGAFDRGRLMMLRLLLNGRTIAAKCNFISGDGAFAFKIAYDESFARFSPGVQLELENIWHIHGHPVVRWMDSCADEDHPMINRLWKDRRAIRTQLISTGSITSDLLVRSLPALRWLHRRVKGAPAASAEPPADAPTADA